MNADIRGALNQIDKSYRAFVHNGQPLTKEQVKSVLEYGLQMGYETTNEISEKQVDRILNKKSATIKLTCETCGIVHELDKTPEIPEHVNSMRCNWCVACEDTAESDYDEWYDVAEEKPFIDPKQLSLF
jgi:hypothetical protein